MNRCAAWRPVLRTAMLAGLLAVLVVGDGIAPPAPSRDAAAATTGAACLDAQERAFLAKLNRHRKRKGLKPLKPSGTLTAAAEHHAEDLANFPVGGIVDHDLSDGTTALENLIDFGYQANWGWGENLAWGTNRETGAQVFAGWKASPAHDANMRKRWARAVGVARVYDARAPYRWYWTATFGGKFDAPLTC